MKNDLDYKKVNNKNFSLSLSFFSLSMFVCLFFSLSPFVYLSVFISFSLSPSLSLSLRHILVFLDTHSVHYLIGFFLFHKQVKVFRSTRSQLYTVRKFCQVSNLNVPACFPCACACPRFNSCFLYRTRLSIQSYLSVPWKDKDGRNSKKGKL